MVLHLCFQISCFDSEYFNYLVFYNMIVQIVIFISLILYLFLDRQLGLKR